VLDQPSDTIKVCLPAMLYTLQNNLFYTAANHLNAATFMVSLLFYFLELLLFFNVK
jgi:UDP-sugar transporter A1/2/3